MVDNRQYELQLIAAVNSVAKALSSGGTSGGSLYSGSSSTSISGIVTALNSITTRLENIVSKLDAALFVEIVENDTTVKKSLATLMNEQNTVLAKVRDAVLNETGQTPVSALTELTAIKQSLDGTTANGVAKQVEAVATALGTTNTALGNIQTNTENTAARLVDANNESVATKLEAIKGYDATEVTALSNIQTNTGNTADRLKHGSYSAADLLNYIDNEVDDVESKLEDIKTNQGTINSSLGTIDSTLGTIKTDTASIDGKLT